MQNFPTITELNAANCRACAFQNKWPEFYEYLNSHYPGNLNLSQKLAMYYQGLTEVPKCVICGNPVKFVNFRTGWRRTCCNKCSQLDPQTIEKKKQTSLKNYGVEWAAASKEHINKRKQTCLSRYGVTNGGWSEEAQKKIKQTNLKNRGTEFPMQDPTVVQKSRDTQKRLYGVEWNSQRPEVKKIKKDKIEETKQKIRETNYQKVVKKHENIIGITEDYKYICKCPHPECNKCEEKTYIITPECYWSRQITERCTHLLPENSSHNKNTSIEIFVKNILDRYGIKYEENNRSLIGKEFDIYCPDLKLAIECNGCWFHSTKFKKPNEHINKYKASKRIGIKLITIWEDWIINTPSIVESIIVNNVGKTFNKIGARECNIREVNWDTTKQFLYQNHIQGPSNTKYNYGLYYQDELVSLMTFKKKGDGWELVRFCNKLNTNVVGGASKLLNHFIKNHQPKYIESFSSCDISDGNLYKTLGFQSNEKITESYWWVESKTHIRYHRSSWSRSNIAKIWSEYDINDKSWTEDSVMNSKGFNKIYDCGQIKWTLTL